MKFSYGALIAVLSRVHEIDTDRTAAFKARLQHYRKVGLLRVPGPLSGPGRHAEYSRADIHRLAFCLQLSDLGIDPTVIAKFIAVRWGGSLDEDLTLLGGSTAAEAKRVTDHETKEAWKKPADRESASTKREARYFVTRPGRLGRWDELFLHQVWSVTELKHNLDLLHGGSINFALINLTLLYDRVEKEIARLIEEEAKKPPGTPRPGRRKRSVVVA